jgi:hypothetical protein
MGPIRQEVPYNFCGICPEQSCKTSIPKLIIEAQYKWDHFYLIAFCQNPYLFPSAQKIAGIKIIKGFQKNTGDYHNFLFASTSA